MSTSQCQYLTYRILTTQRIYASLLIRCHTTASVGSTAFLNSTSSSSSHGYMIQNMTSSDLLMKYCNGGLTTSSYLLYMNTYLQAQRNTFRQPGSRVN